MIRIFFLCTIFFLTGCRPSHRELLDRADEDVLGQRALLAKYIYLQVVKEHPAKDIIRYRALKGLVDVSLTQLYEYPAAVGAMEKILSEFSEEPQFRSEIPDWRWKLAAVWRMNLQKPRKSREILLPLLDRTDLSEGADQEIGLTLQNLNEFEGAGAALDRAWNKATGKNNCNLSREIQMNIIQNFSLNKQCEKALECSEKSLPGDCKQDRFSLAMERAHCFEITGESVSAMKIYEDILKENPKNYRAQFFLDNIKKREKDKVKK